MSTMIPKPNEPPARPTSEDELRFTPRRPVIWFSPSELALTAKKLVISKMFGDYADKRELIGTLPDPGMYDYSGREELWIDFVADLGDGFDATYSVASLLAAPTLALPDPDTKAPVATVRGDVLVMGGDEVYPAASIENYEERTVGPYRAAFPHYEGDSSDGEGPGLFVIPGNHDWYDGLTSWMRIFAQRKYLGGWKTHQTRSYFALKLPHGWWLWGIDVQFESYIDALQLDYFRQVVANEVAAGDQIILCSASPDWVNSHRNDPECFRTLDYFERTVIDPCGATLRVGLSGDLHHYAHYAANEGDLHRFTAGGGGAYLAATHDLPDRLVLPPVASTDQSKSTPAVSYQRQAEFPDRDTSRQMGHGVWSLALKNPSFAGLIGLVYAFYAWATMALPARGQLAQATTVGDIWRGYVSAAEGRSFLDVVGGMIGTPVALLASILMFAIVLGMTKRRGLRRWTVGIVHAVAQTAVLVGALTAVFAAVDGLDGWVALLATVAGAFVVGAAAGPLVLAGYLAFGDRFGRNVNEQFSSMHREDYKNFLRLHIDARGTLTIYPVGLRDIVRRWRIEPEGAPSDPWLVPDGEALTPTLIQSPIRLERQPRSSPSDSGEPS